ncbi:hypothetical protein ColKHC_06919 [Colletotrichum higginsianum]|nr:hypothetical protein ColKHC_06919 [Colletotrichum higginsianum]
MATPTGSTQAQFQNSNRNLPQNVPQQTPMNQQQAPPNGRPAEPQPTGFQKFMKVLCCDAGSMFEYTQAATPG